MADSCSLPEVQSKNNDCLELIKDLERVIENVENISVQLTWMVYDMVALQTNPKMGASMQKLEAAYQRCRAAVCGDRDKEPETARCPDVAATAPAHM